MVTECQKPAMRTRRRTRGFGFHGRASSSPVLQDADGTRAYEAMTDRGIEVRQEGDIGRRRSDFAISHNAPSPNNDDHFHPFGVRT